MKAHVQVTQCYTRRHKMKLDTQAQVGYGINDMSSDRMQEKESFQLIIIGFKLLHNMLLQYVDKQ